MSSMTFWDSKDPNDIDDFALDWTNQLKGEQLTDAAWSFVTAAGAAIEGLVGCVTICEGSALRWY
jgi:hypothetical protein